MTPRATKTFGFCLALLGAGGAWLAIAGTLPPPTRGPVHGQNHPAAEPGLRAAPTVSYRKPQVGDIPSHRPPGYQPMVATGAIDFSGNPVAVSCATCHSTRPTNRSTGLSGTTPREFHQGLAYAHGELSCVTCHNPDDYDALRLADGRRIPYSDAQLLCAQCHGPQTRDYLNGSHGGMTGSWQRTSAERRHRNTCTDCHNVHAPAYPAWTPVFKPRDGGALQQAAREAASPAHP